MKIALTFDDGPNHTTTLEVFELLKKFHIKATFFVIGNLIDESTSKIIRTISEYGCDIENHSFSHSFMSHQSREEIVKEVQRTSDIIKTITGKMPRFFRPPYIDLSAQMFEEIPLIFISGKGVEDWVDEVDANERARRLLETVEDGDIILLHDLEGNHKTVKALEQVLPIWIEQGHRFVTVSELFFEKGQTINAVQGILFQNRNDSELWQPN